MKKIFLMCLMAVVCVLNTDAQVRRGTEKASKPVAKANANAKSFVIANNKLGPIQIGMSKSKLPASFAGLYDKFDYKEETKADMDGEWTEMYLRFFKGGKEIFRAFLGDDKKISSIRLMKGSSFIKTPDGFYVGYSARQLFQKKKMEWGTYYMGEVFASNNSYMYYVNSDYVLTDIPNKASDFKSNATISAILYPAANE